MWDCMFGGIFELLPFPPAIGWDEIGVIATVAAVIVALFANKNANKQLEAALHIQEQSKNVDLFDKRVAVMTAVKEKNETDELSLQLLFDKTIVDAYSKLRASISIQQAAVHDMKVYENMLRQSDGEGGYTSPIAQLQDFERLLDEYGYPDDRVKEYAELCKKWQITSMETEQTGNAKTYNYAELSDRIGRAIKHVEANKNAVLNLMQEYIKRSISPVDEKGGAKVEV